MPVIYTFIEGLSSRIGGVLRRIAPAAFADREEETAGAAASSPATLD